MAARAFAVVLVATGATGATFATQPRLTVVRQPFTVHGFRFAPNERVKVVVLTKPQRTATAKTNANGRFTLVLRNILIPRCGVFTVRATGARGDKAVFKSPRPRCSSATGRR